MSSPAVELWKRTRQEMRKAEQRRAQGSGREPTCAAELRIPPQRASEELLALLAERDTEELGE